MNWIQFGTSVALMLRSSTVEIVSSESHRPFQKTVNKFFPQFVAIFDK